MRVRGDCLSGTSASTRGCVKAFSTSCHSAYYALVRKVPALLLSGSSLSVGRHNSDMGTYENPFAAPLVRSGYLGHGFALILLCGCLHAVVTL